MKYTITRTGNWGTINPIPEATLAYTLEKYLQYERQGKQFMPNPLWAIVKLYRIRTGTFPWGLLNTVIKIFDKYCERGGHEYTITKRLEGEAPKSISATTLRDYQVEAVTALIKHNGGIVCLPTGAGKTITVVEYLKLMNKRSLVIVPTIDIRKQWQNYGVKDMTVSTYQNPKLKDSMQYYDIIVFDECHRVAAKSLYTLAMKVKTEAILIGCSATVEREDKEDMRIHAALGDIVYYQSRIELIKRGFIANAEVTYLKPRFGDVRYMRYPEIYSREVVNNDNRNMLVIDTALKEWRKGRKILILVSQIEHGEKLIMECLAQIRGWEKIPEVVFMNGSSKDRDRDMGVYDIIIATAIYDEGYNLPSLDCIILAAGGKSSIKLTQRIGRVLRPKPDGRPAQIYDFIDSVKYLKGHYLKRRSILEQEFIVIERDNDIQSKLLEEEKK